MSEACDIHCLWNDDPERFGATRVAESWMAKTRLRDRKSVSLPFMSGTWKQLDLSGYDWAFISSYVFAHHAARGARRRSTLVYVHSPARFLWAEELEPRSQSFLAAWGGDFFRFLDVRRTVTDANFAANSHFVRERVRRAWGIEANVIYPPVETERISAVEDWTQRLDELHAQKLDAVPNEFILGASRHVPYKRLDLVIQAGERMGTPVVIAGDGPMRTKLEALGRTARVPVLFTGRIPDAMLYSLYQKAIASVFPATEDFGIMPVEAMAAGGAVAANIDGGTGESVQDGVSGSLFDHRSLEGMVDATQAASAIDSSNARQQAAKFSIRRFQESTALQMLTEK